MTQLLAFPSPCPWQSPVVAIGNFDGVHAGHRFLLAAAKKLDGPLVALTFEPHPREVLYPQKPFKRLMTASEKIAALATLADNVAVLLFTPAVAQWSPTDFVQKVLVDWLGATHVVVGEDFRFGHKAAGDVAFLQSQPAFQTHAVPLQTDESGQPFSSTRLREII